MGLKWITDPVDGDDVCGPDLDESDDEDFLDYYYDALNRLPEEYIKRGVQRSNAEGDREDDEIFKADTFVINDENKTIDGLLKRSRDLRLLVLKFKFECLAGRLVKASDVVCDLADLLEAHGAAVHPLATSDRREALNDLAGPQALHTVILPLQFAGLVGSTEVTLRKLQLAEGGKTAFSFEEETSLDMLQTSLGQPSQRKQVDAAHEAAVKITQALGRISIVCKSQETGAFTPEFSELSTLLTEIRAAITAARPDLRGSDADIEQTDSSTGEADTASDGGGDAAKVQAGAAAAAPVEPTGFVTSHGAAAKALMGCEAYFHANEPSSAAVLLITQARLLIGKPLIETLETLLPEQAGRTVIEFGPQTGFQINIDRLRTLSSQEASAPNMDEGDEVSVNSGAEAAGIIREVERFFHLKEKSSAVPVLLRRARSYLDKDFQALVDELLPEKEKS